MGTRWNYWHVYQFMVTHFAQTGLVPERTELLVEFAELEPVEVDEGIAEFELVINKRHRGAEQNDYKEA
ncbi:hypothetical protein [Paenibacillus monticola]|uniref:Uncharacterized protein n=1 Tax=Paenibacillus monticola TaxID=2666075 RepID=A0A7X2HCA8_9BACL|nr:hypothetical protein [Paenibacillus monticola]MRN56808.1 hypothetical protein [Paenibacillus monticola]